MSLANQFIEAVGAARDTAAIDEIARLTWRAHAGGQLTGAEAEAVSEALADRRAALARPEAMQAVTAALKPTRLATKRREKLFGMGRPRALDRNAKVRIMHWARCLSRKTEKGKAYGLVTAKALAVLQALLWGFHNAKSGVCFPGYERIAEAAGCARSTVHEAIKAIEDAGLLTWVNRLKRVREPVVGGLAGIGATRSRVVRTSNSYAFTDPSPAAERPQSSKSEKPTGTSDQGFFSLPVKPAAAEIEQAFGGIERKIDARPQLVTERAI